MITVIWSADADRPGFFQYFTRGPNAAQLEQANDFAASLRIDPERGFVSIRNDGRDGPKPLLQRWLSEGPAA